MATEERGCDGCLAVDPLFACNQRPRLLGPSATQPVICSLYRCEFLAELTDDLPTILRNRFREAEFGERVKARGEMMQVDLIALAVA